MRRALVAFGVACLCTPMLSIALIARATSPAAASVAPGTASSWGSNFLGALGAPSVPGAFVLVPAQVGTSGGWKSAATAGPASTSTATTSYAIRTDGTLWAWGDNRAGQFGTGDTAGTGPLLRQVGSDSDWASVVTSSDGVEHPHTFAIKTDGSLWAWGIGLGGVLGDGGTSQQLTPERIGTGNDWAQVATADEHTLALKTDGSLWAWGTDSVGQLGDNTTNSSLVPERIGTAGDWASIAAGAFYSLATKTDGTLWAWGADDDGRLGDGSTTDKHVPTRIGTATSWTSVVATDEQQLPPSSFALRSDGTLWGWGGNQSGQLGSGTTFVSAPTQIGTDTHWAEVAFGPGGHTVGIKTDGSLWAWGGNADGELGDGTTTKHVSPEQIAAGQSWTNVSAGTRATVAVRADGTLWAWGYDWYPDNPPHVPLLVPQWRTAPGPVESANHWVAVSAELGDVIALRDDGTLWAWGYNAEGEVGDGTITKRLQPVEIGTSTDWRTIAGSGLTSFAIRADGTLWSWGDTDDSQTGRMGDRTVPGQVGTDTWSAVAGGRYHTVAIRSDGSLWAWGADSAGEIGDGNVGAGWPFPRHIGIDTDWASVTAGVKFTLAIKGNGTLWSWGDNSAGQLGSGATGGVRSTPQQVGTDTHWRSVQANNNHVVAVKTDGTLWAWGDDTDGVLGDGATTGIVNTPEQIGTDTDWSSVAAGFTHSLALKSDGTVWAWGDNSVGQLGDGSTTNRSTPVLVGNASNWLVIGAGDNYSIALGATTASSPGAPVSVRTDVPTNGATASVSFLDPVSNGGRDITGYTATCSSTNGGTTRSASTSASPISVSNLTLGKTYACFVSATNNIGTGGLSSASNAVVVGAPGAPRTVTASAGTGSATVKWSAPAANGGDPIVAYLITPFLQGVALPAQRFNSPALSEKVTGLQKGKSYTFVVAAANGNGTGPTSSASNAVSPK